MKIEPIVTDKLYTVHTSFVVDFMLNYNITFIIGDSGVGKSAVYSIIEEMGTEDERIRCLNYLDYKKSYKTSIKNSKNKLFVIDNADLLLNDEMRQYIATDSKNQYIIIGRNPAGLILMRDNIFELETTRDNQQTVFTLKQSF